MENTIGITLETGVGVQSAILHVCQVRIVSSLEERTKDACINDLYSSALSSFAAGIQKSRVGHRGGNF